MKLDLIRGCCGYRNVGTANFVTFTVLSFGCVCPQPDVFVDFPSIMVGSRSRRGPWMSTSASGADLPMAR